jgi:hypothetical protein
VIQPFSAAPPLAPFNVAAFLADIAHSRHYRGQIARVVQLPEQEARFGELSRPLPLALREALDTLGIEQLYTPSGALRRKPRAKGSRLWW